MWLSQTPELFYYLSGAILLFVMGRLFLSPLRALLHLLLNALTGILALFALNAIGGIFSFSIAVNATTLLTAGLLGIPGVCLLALLRWMGM